MLNPKTLVAAAIIFFAVTSPAVALDGTTAADVEGAGVALPADKLFRGVVVEVVDQQDTVIEGVAQPSQLVKVKIQDSPEEDKEVVIQHGGRVSIRADQKVHLGEKVVIIKTHWADGEEYYIQDHYRLPALYWIGALFVALIIFLGRWRGLSSLLGLAFTILVLMFFIVPQIVAGRNALLISLVGAIVIAVVSLYLAHGLNRRTSMAVVSTLLTLLLATGLALIFVWATRLFGFGSEEAYEAAFLQKGVLAGVDFRGLLLGGMLIGALGILDDITTAQTAAVEEIKNANPALTARELYARGFSVGREHISSLVNTLVLAYAGASFPLLLLFASNNSFPAWAIANGENIAEEIVRTAVGSIALVLAVPIATGIAAWKVGRR